MASDLITIMRLLSMGVDVVAKLTDLARRASEGEEISDGEVRFVTQKMKESVQGWDDAVAKAKVE